MTGSGGEGGGEVPELSGEVVMREKKSHQVGVTPVLFR